MTAAPRDRSHDGPACEIDWEEDDFLLDPVFGYSLVWTPNPPRPHPSSFLMTTWPDGMVSPRAPLWPQTHPGLKLRSLFLFYGERILCAPFSYYEAPAFWWEERSYTSDLHQ